MLHNTRNKSSAGYKQQECNFRKNYFVEGKIKRCFLKLLTLKTKVVVMEHRRRGFNFLFHLIQKILKPRTAQPN